MASLLLTALLALASAPRGALGATCQRKTTALTSDCASICYDGRPCIAYAASANLTLCTDGTQFSECRLGGNGSCAFECFKNGADDQVARGIVDFSTYTFLLPFGASKSNWEDNWTTAEKAAYKAAEETFGDWTGSLPSKSNDVVQNAEALSFLAATKKVYVLYGVVMFFKRMLTGCLYGRFHTDAERLRAGRARTARAARWPSSRSRPSC